MSINIFPGKLMMKDRIEKKYSYFINTYEIKCGNIKNARINSKILN